MFALTLLCMGILACAPTQSFPNNTANPGELFGSKTPYYVAQGQDLNILDGKQTN